MLAPSKDGRFLVPAALSVLLETVSFRQAGPQLPNVADFSSCGIPSAQPLNAAQTASQGQTGASVTAVTDVTGNLSPIFPVTPVTPVTRITGDMQLSRVPGSACRDIYAGFIQVWSMLCKFFDSALGEIVSPVSCSSNVLSSVAVPVKVCSRFRNSERKISSGSAADVSLSIGFDSSQVCVSFRKQSSSTRDSMSRPVQ